MRRKSHLIFQPQGLASASWLASPCPACDNLLRRRRRPPRRNLAGNHSSPAAEGWLFDARDRRGVLRIKTKALLLADGFSVKIAI